MLKLVFEGGAAPERGPSSVITDWRDEEGKLIGEAFSVPGASCILWPGLGAFSFSPNCVDVRVWPEPGLGREAVARHFYRILQPVVLQALGRQALHAAAAAGPSGAVAFCGKSHSGKSTLAFAMGRRGGWKQLADDSIVWEVRGDCAVVASLPFSPRLRKASETFFGAPSESLPSGDAQGRTIPLVAIFILQQDFDARTPKVSVLPSVKAFPALLAHAHLFYKDSPEHVGQLVKAYMQLAAAAPVFSLVYAPDFRRLGSLTDLVAETIEGVSSNSGLARSGPPLSLR